MTSFLIYVNGKTQVIPTRHVSKFRADINNKQKSVFVT